ncbi:MAG: hypothetical protein ACYCOU_24375, partial [Sulfobacillus sp.]
SDWRSPSEIGYARSEMEEMTVYGRATFYSNRCRVVASHHVSRRLRHPIIPWRDINTAAQNAPSYRTRD